MARNRVEGYFTNEPNGAKQGADSWVYGLRKEARRELIRRLTMERIQQGGLNDGPKANGLPPISQSDSIFSGFPKLPHVVEGILIGVFSAYLCHLLGINKKGRK